MWAEELDYYEQGGMARLYTRARRAAELAKYGGMKTDIQQESSLCRSCELKGDKFFCESRSLCAAIHRETHMTLFPAYVCFLSHVLPSS